MVIKTVIDNGGAAINALPNPELPGSWHSVSMLCINIYASYANVMQSTPPLEMVSPKNPAHKSKPHSYQKFKILRYAGAEDQNSLLFHFVHEIEIVDPPRKSAHIKPITTDCTLVPMRSAQRIQNSPLVAAQSAFGCSLEKVLRHRHECGLFFYSN